MQNNKKTTRQDPIELKLKELEAKADKHIIMLNSDSLEHFEHEENNGIVVIMPATNPELATICARRLYRRAGMDCTIIIVLDSKNQGFINILNSTSQKTKCKYIVYLAQDAYPGRNWLKYAYKTLEESQKGLLAFNDGKWSGHIASFGMVRKSWAKTLYKKGVFYPGYRSHGADNELTVIARAMDMFVYDPDATLLELDDKKDLAGSNKFDKSLFNKRYLNGFDGLVQQTVLKNLAPEYRVPGHYFETLLPKKLQEAKYVFNQPRFVVKPYCWIKHTPFAFYLIENINPRVFLEIGTNHGNAYFSFCQAVHDLKINTKCYSVSNWSQPDGQKNYIRAKSTNKKEFSKFSSLERLPHNEALSYHKDKSIDLLHICNIERYDLIKDCFNAWLPKMSQKGIVLIHGTNHKHERNDIWRFFEEIKNEHLAFEFIFGEGLGVVCIGKNVDFRFTELIEEARHSPFFTEFFNALGETVFHKTLYADIQEETRSLDRLIQKSQKTTELKEAEVASYKHQLKNKTKELEQFQKIITELSENIQAGSETINTLKQEIIFARNTIEKLTLVKEEHEARISRKNKKMAEQQSAIQILEEDLQNLNHEVEKSKAALKQIKKQNQNIKNELLYMKQTLGWKITKPFRWLKQTISRLKSNALWPYYLSKALVKLNKSSIKRELHFFKHKKLLKDSPLFCPDYYLTTYPDVAKSDNDPVAHYLRRGAFEGRNPSKNFSTNAYLENNKDVANAEINPLVHYLVSGKKENRAIYNVTNQNHTTHNIRGPLYAYTKKEKKEYKEAEKQIKKLRLRLFNLGFVEKALCDLQDLVGSSNKNKHLNRLAARELALWHANKKSPEDIKKVFPLLSVFRHNEKDPAKLRMSAVLEAECLAQTGEITKARDVIEKTLTKQKHADLYFALANLENDLQPKLQWINTALALHSLSEIACREEENKSPYDRLEGPDKLIYNNLNSVESPLVTVIIPAYNAEQTIHVALNSLLKQTWRNLEILVSDDFSTDATKQVIREFTKKDYRVRLIESNTNAGPYVARNLALKKARGEFVTVNDADDWSHPEKIQIQVEDLIQHPSVVANTTQLARVFSDLTFYRRGNYGTYLIKNYSSLMFRRDLVMDELGFWDSVRFGADADLIERIQKTFGVKNIKCGPVFFAKQTTNSLTGNNDFGVHGFLMGARKEYTEARHYYHKTAPSLYYEFPQTHRPFAVPEPLWPKREVKNGEKRRFDVIMASDFRLPGGTTMSNMEEIKAQCSKGLRTGLIQMPRYDLNPEKPINHKIRELIDGDLVQMLVYGEDLCCDLLTIRYPPVLQEWQRFIPTVEAKTIRVIINQPPQRDYGSEGELRYSIPVCNDRIKEYFGKEAVWHPNSPLVREVLISHHAEDLNSVCFSEKDWVNIINLEEWKRPKKRPTDRKIRIGRHTRDDPVKWPESQNELLSIYPNIDPYEVFILGGDRTPKNILGKIPENWKTYDFGAIHPKDFLHDLDVFVYFTHHDWVESFSRAILEAMAAGVPVVLPLSDKKLFGNAAVYAKPDQVKEKINELIQNESLYNEQVQRAWDYVSQNFGHGIHINRISSF